MKIVYSALFIALLASCTKKDIYVPQADVTIVSNVTDYSTVSMLYNKEVDSVKIDVKDNGIITQTNWLYQIDKRLPLKLIIPEVTRLQTKKLGKAKAEAMPSYFTYMDTVAKVIAYMPLHNVEYKNTETDVIINSSDLKLNVNQHGQILLNNQNVTITDLNTIVANLYPDQVVTLYLLFDKNLTFEKYLQIKLQLAKITLPNVRLATAEIIY